MPHDDALDHWQGRLATHLPELPEADRRWLAWASYGVALAGSAAVTAVALTLAVALALPAATALQRLRELYRPAAAKPGRARRGFEPTACFAPLLRWAAGDAPRLAVALDATDLAGRLTSWPPRSCATAAPCRWPGTSGGSTAPARGTTPGPPCSTPWPRPWGRGARCWC